MVLSPFTISSSHLLFSIGPQPPKSSPLHQLSMLEYWGTIFLNRTCVLLHSPPKALWERFIITSSQKPHQTTRPSGSKPVYQHCPISSLHGPKSLFLEATKSNLRAIPHSTIFIQIVLTQPSLSEKTSIESVLFTRFFPINYISLQLYVIQVYIHLCNIW